METPAAPLGAADWSPHSFFHLPVEMLYKREQFAE
jgi:hypothetical protein